MDISLLGFHKIQWDDKTLVSTAPFTENLCDRKTIQYPVNLIYVVDLVYINGIDNGFTRA